MNPIAIKKKNRCSNIQRVPGDVKYTQIHARTHTHNNETCIFPSSFVLFFFSPPGMKDDLTVVLNFFSYTVVLKQDGMVLRHSCEETEAREQK